MMQNVTKLKVIMKILILRTSSTDFNNDGNMNPLSWPNQSIKIKMNPVIASWFIFMSSLNSFPVDRIWWVLTSFPESSSCKAGNVGLPTDHKGFMEGPALMFTLERHCTKS